MCRVRLNGFATAVESLEIEVYFDDERVLKVTGSQKDGVASLNIFDDGAGEYLWDEPWTSRLDGGEEDPLAGIRGTETCAICGGTGFLGVDNPKLAKGEYEVQRCDECRLYESDAKAAEAQFRSVRVRGDRVIAKGPKSEAAKLWRR